MSESTKWQIPNKWTILLILTVCGGALVATTWKPGSSASTNSATHFKNATREAGITFVHSKPVFDSQLNNIMPWMSAVGASASAADYENSGNVSVFLTNSAHGSQNALLRNEGSINGVPQFRDVTVESGLGDLNANGSCMAAAWGDYDNDGFPDLFVVREGAGNLLFHNEPMLDKNGQPVKDAAGVARRKFVDVTQSAGLGHVGYGVGALWFDYDRDGKLDLLVADYFPSLYLDADHHETAEPLDLWHLTSTKIMAESFNDARNGGGVLLFHNEGNGHFQEVHKEVGLTDTGWALSLGAGDLNNDGWPDIYVANDFGADDLYMNVPDKNGHRRFVRVEGGITADKIGRDTKKGMNVDFGDFDHSGFQSIYVTNITQHHILPEGNMLWKSYPDKSRPGGLNFTEMAEGLGIYECGWGWGAKFVDVNNDGWLDLFVLNGFISADKKQNYWYELQNTVSDYHTILSDSNNWPPIGNKSLAGYQKSCLFVRTGERFEDMAAASGIDDDYDGRGVALADFNNSGAADFFVSNQGQPALLYMNELYQRCSGAQCPHWIGFHLHGNGTTSNRDAIGARVILESNSSTQTAEVSRGNGFASQSDPRVRFGLGQDATIKSIKILWPDGKEQILNAVKTEQYHEITEQN
jgi:enediyne biosynthesis protein E4